MIIVSIICLSVLTFNTYGLADITLNPYCTGDTDRIEELTENFISKYGEENVKIDWNESMNNPERIHIYSTELFNIVKIPVGNNSIFYEYVSEHFPNIDYSKLQEVEIPAITKLVIYPKRGNVYLIYAGNLFLILGIGVTTGIII